MEEQVKSAIDKIRPMLQSHGGGIEFVEIKDKTVYVRLQGACAGNRCSRSSISSSRLSSVGVTGPPCR